MICHEILERVSELDRLGCDSEGMNLKGLKKNLFSKINELENELTNNPQLCRAVVDEFLEKIAEIKSVISHAEKSNSGSLNPSDSVNMAGLLTQHIDMVKNVRNQLPVLKSLEEFPEIGITDS